MARIFAEKKLRFAQEGQSLKNFINQNLNMQLEKVRVINLYDVDHLLPEQVKRLKNEILHLPNVDQIFEKINLHGKKYFAYQYLPAQFDARANAVIDCVKLLFPEVKLQVKTGKIYVFDDNITPQEIVRIKDLLINKVEAREMDLNALTPKSMTISSDASEFIFHDFINYSKQQLKDFSKQHALAMNFDDLCYIQNYFKNQKKRNPTITEIKVLDPYWSDHCRHTTFETEIKNITIEPSPLAPIIAQALNEFEKARLKLRPDKPRTLMNLATINFQELRSRGLYQDVEISQEINAASIFVNVDVDKKLEKYLIQFKNETHNHPTEIEPFGGASTCLGGAIRDPLSGRAYVYQALRVTGGANPLEKIKDTLEGKLPQQIISKRAAEGFSSYGNQVGVATTLVEEIIHPGFKAKRLEAGAVVGAALASHVKRKIPVPGDLILMIGGKTGKDGIGGATGSSKTLTKYSQNMASSEVQKGNAPEERKLQRLFSQKNFAQLVKKANDFGAGGIAVAIGELADSLEINLNAVKLKYQGLTAWEIALSESQERMAIVIDPLNLHKVKELILAENLAFAQVATVTNTGHLIMKFNNQEVVNIDRKFLKTNGIRQKVNATIKYQKPYQRVVPGKNFQEQFFNNLKDINVASQKGLTQMFDSTIGTSTVLHPYGGKTQLTKAHVSVQKVPMNGHHQTNTVTMLAQAYNPLVTSASPFLGGVYAIVASISKIIAYGGNLTSLKFSLQEFFEKLGTDDKKWGEPLAALLGASYALRQFNHGAIGGKDSMAGTFGDLHVPPTLIAFALSIANANDIISSEFKKVNNYVYVLKHDPLENGMPDFAQLKNNYKHLEKLIKTKQVVAAWPLVKGGIAEALVQMAQGNDLGFKVKCDFDMFDFNYGTIVIESPHLINLPNFILIGQVVKKDYVINDHAFLPLAVLKAWSTPLSNLFPTHVNAGSSFEDKLIAITKSFSPKKITKTPLVIIPVFPGTNCENDLERRFLQEGAVVKQVIFKNQSSISIKKSLMILSEKIAQADILVLPGGFSAADEPDGSGKFIANVLRSKEVAQAIGKLLAKKGLILGICNGFQALIQTGLLPGGKIKKPHQDDPALFKNNTNSHVAKYVNTRLASINSPWLAGFKLNTIHSVPISHGEGQIVASKMLIKRLKKQGQIAFQYVDDQQCPTQDGRYNPNGSSFAIEGMISPDGLILGKMAHSERYGENIAKNIWGNKDQNIFKNAMKYFRGDFK